MDETTTPLLEAQPAARDIAAVAATSVLTALQTRSEGLTQAEVIERLATFGPNALVPRLRIQRWFSSIAVAIRPLLLPLWAAAAIAFAVGSNEVGWLLVTAALLNTIAGAIQEHKAERATDALGEALPGYAHVIREGKDAHILASQVVPGDLLLLHSGEIVPADARVIKERDLRTVSVALIGETAATRRVSGAITGDELLANELSNIVYAGSRIVSGTAHAVVFATGRRTAYGQIAALTETAHEAPSQLVWAFAGLGFRVMVLATIITGTTAFYLWNQYPHDVLNRRDLLLIVIGLLTASVPAGLMPGITVTLLEGGRRLTRLGVLVRRLSSVETLGATTVICADKTGTLTQNEMTARELWTVDGPIVVTGVGFTPTGEFLVDDKAVDHAILMRRCGALLRAAVHTSAARLLPPDTLQPHWHILGDAIEAAALVVAAKAGYQINQLYEEVPQIIMLPASDRLQLEGCVVEEKSTFIAYLKGPPAAFVSRCTAIATANGERPITEQDRQVIRRALHRYERNAMRTIAFARKVVTEDIALELPQTTDVAHDMIFLGFIAVLDPPREDVQEAIRACHRAGIRTMMLTGDYALSAESLARRCALVEKSRTTTITGIELEHMEDATLRERLKVGDLVFAHMTPQHKVRIVEMLNTMGEVVLVTGGAANDVPAIKAADIGVAMGTSSSAAALQTADVVLKEDNFAAIAAAVAEGRAIEQRSRRLVALGLGTTVVKLGAYLLGILAGWPLILTIGQLLLIDLLGSFAPSLALGAGPPSSSVMKRQPRRSGHSLLDTRIYRIGYGWFGLISLIVALAGAAITMLMLGVQLQPNIEVLRLLTDETIPVHYLEVATAYIVTGIAALGGIALRLRKTRRQYPFFRILLAGVLCFVIAVLAVLAYVPELFQPLVVLAIPPWWIWLAGICGLLVATLLESGRQRIDPLPQ